MSYNYSNNYGLNPDYNYYEFSLDSNQAQRAYNTSYAKQNWPVYFLGGKRDLINIAAVKILEVQIPFSYYVFTSINPPKWGSGRFVYTDPNGSTIKSLVGNYTQAEFITAFTNELNAARAFLGGAGGFNVTYNSQTGKFAVTTNGWIGQFSIDFDTDNGYQLVGLNAGVNQSTVGGVLLFPNCPLLSGPNYLYLNSTTMGSLVNLYLPTNELTPGGNAGPQIAKIPVNVEPTGVIYWQDPDPQKWFDVESLNQLQQLDFYMTLGTGQEVINLNGLSFSVKLGILLNKDTQNQNQKSSTVQRMTSMKGMIF